MRNYDAIILVTIALSVLFTWLSTYIVYRRKLIAERSAHRHDLTEKFSATFEAGVIAGRDEARREQMNTKLAKRLSLIHI